MASISRMAIRSFSSTAAVAQSAAQQLVRPAVPVFGVDGRYAAALFSAASKQKELDKVERDMKVVGELLEKNKDVAGKCNVFCWFDGKWVSDSSLRSLINICLVRLQLGSGKIARVSGC